MLELSQAAKMDVRRVKGSLVPRPPTRPGNEARSRVKDQHLPVKNKHGWQLGLYTRCETLKSLAMTKH